MSLKVGGGQNQKYANFTDTCYKHLLHYSYSPSYVFNMITSLSYSLLSLNLFQQNRYILKTLMIYAFVMPNDFIQERKVGLKISLHFRGQ